MIGIQVSNTSDKPIYQQIYEQISSQILSGKYENHSGLPPIRTAAKELRISIITVKKAWEELERSGLIYTVTGRGCFVSELSPEDRLKKRDEIVKVQLTRDLMFYRNLEISVDELISLIKTNFS